MKKTLYFLILSFALFGCATSSTSSSYSSIGEYSSSTSSSRTSSIAELNIQTMLQQYWLNEAYAKTPDYASGVQELSRPNSLTLNLTGGDSYQIEIRELDNSKNIVDTYTVETTKSLYEATNFKINTYYRYAIKSFTGGEISRSYTSRIFKTVGYLRNLSVPGVTNVRDLGGYVTEEGKTVKQGLLFRSGCWTQNALPVINSDGVEVVKNQLRIKSEIDLRNTDANETGGQTDDSVEGITYHSYQMEDWNDWGTKTSTSVRNCFKLMADIKNYPIDYHCYIGTDRTGLVSFFIQSILGASEERLFRDYLFSNFGNIGGSRTSNAIDNYLKRVTKYGTTIREKVTNYLVEKMGVELSHINAIREIMLTD